MIYLKTPETKVLRSVPLWQWREPSAAQPKDEFGNANSTRFVIKARLHDGHVVWKGVYEDRFDFDAVLWAIATGTLHIQPELWPLSTPSWYPDLGGHVTYEFATTVLLTTPTGSSTWSKPGDWNNFNNTVDLLAGGGGAARGLTNTNGRSGGGGGAWSRQSNISISGTTASIAIGVGGTGGTVQGVDGGTGGNSWFNGTALASASVSAEGGIGGDGGDPTTGPGRGGLSTNGIGSLKYSGGTGGAGQGGNGYGGGGGGAAGPNGNGNNGSTSTGGSGDAGFGGAGGTVTQVGQPGLEYGTFGSGGGGGGGTGAGGGPGQLGGLYGAGGGGGGTTSAGAGNGAAGRQGFIYITYEPLISGGNMPMLGM